MTKYLKVFIVVLSIFTLSFVSVSAETEEREVVYFGSTSCLVCQRVKDEGLLEALEDLGVTVTIYELEDGAEFVELLAAYNYTYNFIHKPVGPIIFSGGEYYFNYDGIKAGVDSGEIYNNSINPLLEVDVIEYRSVSNMSGFQAFFTALAGGFVDGFNPCAIAMLLLFISLLGFTSNKKLLIAVSTTYIFALFISYYLLGYFVVNSIQYFNANVKLLSTVISWIIIVLGFGLFFFNMYDYLVSRKKDYGQVKNQLPKYIQKLNKRIIRVFTNLINKTEDNIFGFITLLLLTFGLGVIISLTEFLCTGQVYLPVIFSLSLQPTFTDVHILLLLLLYNFMFVLPLIVISVTAIKTKSALSVSNFIREKMHIIKLITALFFLAVALYYVYDLFIVRG
ncbi:hypothetical protein CI105_06730 [Candidatus Izimaplasma bacterium ZiA1]|uniref:hypothetical protein n=1 Tax=Candidatus Izimoplasma sp. ZiA1 TaxID=2024899 RepID=UPI000BAA5B90|nr:hypothetical protein CI105_06730 [Candidatus Izimaplasma bacterium ZiA1]